MQGRLATATAVAAAGIFVGQARGASIFSDAAAFIFGSSGRHSLVPAADFLALAPKGLNGAAFSFAQLKDKVTLVTNVASECGLTASNYKELVELHNKLSSQGLEIVAFPCNQFGKQEPGSAADIRKFADSYGVGFHIMAKSDVNGPDTNPVYRLLKGPEGSDIRWNFFTKFLVQCRSEWCDVYRYDGAPKPGSLEKDIQQLLAKQRDGDL